MNDKLLGSERVLHQGAGYRTSAPFACVSERLKEPVQKTGSRKLLVGSNPTTSANAVHFGVRHFLLPFRQIMLYWIQDNYLCTFCYGFGCMFVSGYVSW